MGMWDETVAANTVASGPERSAWVASHPSSWLHYGLLQQGRLAEARRLLRLTRGNLTGDARPAIRAHYVMMRAHEMVVAGAWEDSLLLEPVAEEGLGRMVRGAEAFVRGYGALRRGDRAAAARWQRELERDGAGAPAREPFGDNPTVVAVLRRELLGAVRLADGDTAGALATLREATQLEDALAVDYGPPNVVKPTHELFGEVLLAAGRPHDAQTEFTRALALAPRRPLSLLGLARSAAAAGDTTTASRTWADLRRVWARADPGIPGLDEVARAVSAAGPGAD